MTERLHRLLVWLGCQLAPRSPARAGDEQVAASILYSTSKRGVHATPRKRPRDVEAPGVTVQQEIKSHGRYTF